MKLFPPTIILRHRKERLSKCSLRGLEGRPDMQFFSYPWTSTIPPLQNVVILALDAPLLSRDDADKSVFLIDGTWRYAKKMESSLPLPFEKRSLPPIQTAYRRRQHDCQDPARGLASVEALYLAYHILGRSTEGLLDNYSFREEFLNGLHLRPKIVQSRV